MHRLCPLFHRLRGDRTLACCASRKQYFYMVQKSNQNRTLHRRNECRCIRRQRRSNSPAAANASFRSSPASSPPRQGCHRRRLRLPLVRGIGAPQAPGAAPRPGPAGPRSRREVQQVEGEAREDSARRRRRAGRALRRSQGSSSQRHRSCSRPRCCCCCCRSPPAASTASKEERNRDPLGAFSENLCHRPHLLEQALAREGNRALLC